MKALILTIGLTIVLLSCEEKEQVNPDPLAGNWSFQSNDLKFSFDMIEKYGVHKGVNGRVEYPSLTRQQWTDNLVSTNPASDGGFLDLRLRSHSPVYYSVWMKNVDITSEGLLVERMEVMMPGKEYVLENQVLLKNSR